MNEPTLSQLREAYAKHGESLRLMHIDSESGEAVPCSANPNDYSFMMPEHHEFLGSFLAIVIPETFIPLNELQIEDYPCN
jgi:hypothetical protein